MPKSSPTNSTNKRPREPFDPALEAPIALTPDELEAVVGGSTREGSGGGTTTGYSPPSRLSSAS
jgi:hypothetical protein